MQTIGYRKITMRTDEGKVVMGWGRD